MKSCVMLSLIWVLNDASVNCFPVQQTLTRLTTAFAMSPPEKLQRREFFLVATAASFSLPSLSRAEGLPYYKKEDEYAVGPAFQKDRATRVRRLTKRAFVASAKSLANLLTIALSMQRTSNIRKTLRDYPFANLRKDGKEIMTLLVLEDEAFPSDTSGSSFSKPWGKLASAALDAVLVALEKLDYACLRIEQRLDDTDTETVDSAIIEFKESLLSFAQITNAFADSVLGEPPLAGVVSNPAPEDVASAFSSRNDRDSTSWVDAIRVRQAPTEKPQ